MANALDKRLERWVSAGIVDAGTAARIKTFEESQSSSERLRWPVLLAVALGGVLLCAGVLLFVAAHWDELSPAWRFTLVLILVAVFPIAGALTEERFSALGNDILCHRNGLCRCGNFSDGANFQSSGALPTGILMWAAGALAGWLLLKHWTQAALLALLVPGWLVGEWEVRTQRFAVSNRLITEGLVLIAITYLSARTSQEDSNARRALAWIGGLAVLPLAVWAFFEGRETWRWWQNRTPASSLFQITGWAIAICGPLALAFVLRKNAAWTNAIAAVWVLVIGTFGAKHEDTGGSLSLFAWNSIGPIFGPGRRARHGGLGIAGAAA